MGCYAYSASSQEDFINMMVTGAQPQLSFLVSVLTACAAILTLLLLSYLTLDGLLNFYQPPSLHLLNAAIKRTCNTQVVKTPCSHTK